MTGPSHDEPVAPPDGQRVGLFLIRVWAEAPPSGGFRARLIETPDIEHSQQTTTATDSIDEVCLRVRHFIDTFRSR